MSAFGYENKQAASSYKYVSGDSKYGEEKELEEAFKKINKKWDIFLIACLILCLILLFFSDKKGGIKYWLLLFVTSIYFIAIVHLNFTIIKLYLFKSGRSALEAIVNFVKSNYIQKKERLRKKEVYNERKLESMIEETVSNEKRYNSEFMSMTNSYNENRVINNQSFYNQIPNRDNQFTLFNNSKSFVAGEEFNSNSIKIINKVLSCRDYKQQLIPIENHVNFDEIEFEILLKQQGLDRDLGRLIKSMKHYIKERLLPKLLDHHLINLNTINKLLKPYSIKLESSLDRSDVSGQIVNLLRQRIINSQFNYAFNHVEEHDEKIIPIFCADSKKLHTIITTINEKLKNIENLKHEPDLKYGNKSSQFRDNFSRIPGVYNKNSDEKFNLLSSGDQMSTIIYKNREAEDTLDKLKVEIQRRIDLNLLIYTEICHPIETEDELFVLMDYIYSRLEELNKLSFNSFQSSSGGQYRDIHWISFFPTDVSIIAEIIVKSLQNAVIENSNLTKCFMISFPFKPELNNKVDNILLYKASPKEYESHFEVVHKGSVIKIPPVRLHNNYINI